MQPTRLTVMAIAAMFVFLSTAAHAQTCTSTGPAQDISGPGTVSMVASTTVNNCSNRTVRVESRFPALAMEICTGTVSAGKCTRETVNTNAVVTIAAEACGYWIGASDHFYKDGSGSFTPVYSSTQFTTLFAGNCPPPPEEECEEPDYYWDGENCVPVNCPIIIATGRAQTYALTSPAEGVRFDMDGDGMPEQVAWTKPGSEVAFLALDIDGDGRVTSGKELFGNHTVVDEPNGFAALARLVYESNAGRVSGSVSADDVLFDKLLLWTDSNHNGVSEPQELQAASGLFSDIGLGYQMSNRRDGFGSRLRFRGWAHVRTAPGRNRASDSEGTSSRRIYIYDAYFGAIR